jgi:hypothetical protein
VYGSRPAADQALDVARLEPNEARANADPVEQAALGVADDGVTRNLQPLRDLLPRQQLAVVGAHAVK